MKLSGPYGQFVLRTWEDKPVVMLAAGTACADGVHGANALVNGEYSGHIAASPAPGRPRSCTTSRNSGRWRRSTPDQATYHACPGRRPRLPARPGQTSWRPTSTVSAAIRAYICGSPAMVESSLKSLMAKRLFPRDIFHEDFFNEGDKASGSGPR